jgi:hypothetical protein
VKQLSLVIVQDSRKLVGSSLPGQEDSQSQQCERSDAEAKDVAESAGGLAGRRAEETVARRASQAQHEAHARAAELDRQVQQKEHELREQASLRVSQAAAAGDDLSKCANLAADATASASPGSAAASSTQPLERYVVSGAGAPAVDGEYVPASFLVFGPVCESIDVRLASLPVIGTLLAYARAADPRVLLLRWCATAGIDRGPAPWRAGMYAVLRTTACPRGSTAKACGCSAG